MRLDAPGRIALPPGSTVSGTCAHGLPGRVASRTPLQCAAGSAGTPAQRPERAAPRKRGTARTAAVRAAHEPGVGHPERVSDDGARRPRERGCRRAVSRRSPRSGPGPGRSACFALLSFPSLSSVWLTRVCYRQPAAAHCEAALSIDGDSHLIDQADRTPLEPSHPLPVVQVRARFATCIWRDSGTAERVRLP